jgi:hypothetical protein
MNIMTTSMDSIIYALVGTPLWVWGILTYLLFIGIRAIKIRLLHPLRLFVVPIIFTGINYKLIFSGNNFSTYMIFLITGFLIGFFVGLKTSIKILHNLKRIELPGNYYTIAFLLLFFIGKYILGYLGATDPSMIIKYTFIDTCISGLLSGYFLGIAFCYLKRYYQRTNNYYL